MTYGKTNWTNELYALLFSLSFTYRGDYRHRLVEVYSSSLGTVVVRPVCVVRQDGREKRKKSRGVKQRTFAWRFSPKHNIPFTSNCQVMESSNAVGPRCWPRTRVWNRNERFWRHVTEVGRRVPSALSEYQGSGSRSLHPPPVRHD